MIDCATFEQVVELNMTGVDISTYDFIWLYDGDTDDDSTYVGRIDGSYVSTLTYVSNQPNLLVKLTSISANSSAGFDASIKAVAPGIMSPVMPYYKKKPCDLLGQAKRNATQTEIQTNFVRLRSPMRSQFFSPTNVTAKLCMYICMHFI